MSKDYKKLYEEALERARKLATDLPNGRNDRLYHVWDLENIFPELKESEDERIRKEIIQSIKDNMCVIHKEKCLAWLEKQGENKLANKVEPKFKNGQWIVWQNKCYKVNYNGCGYELIDQNGLSTSLEYVTVDENAHLWTIQDAKDGDVLYSHCCKLLWIYKDGNSCYIGNNLNYNENCVVVNSSICIPNDVTPATKEQRDLLFQKIKESGYEWNVEKKELNKIEKQGEQKPTPKFKIGDTIHKIGENTVFPMTIEKIEDGYYVCNNSHSFVNIEFQDYYELVEQKPSWSKEDSKNLNSVKWIIENSDNLNKIFETIDSPDYIKKYFIDWLKSLKDRVQPKSKQEWSEEDEDVINHLIAICAGAKRYRQFAGCLQDDITKYQTWLKSIKPNHWKPSEEQMKALIKRTKGLHTNSETRKVLESLIFDLQEKL